MSFKYTKGCMSKKAYNKINATSIFTLNMKSNNNRKTQLALM